MSIIFARCTPDIILDAIIEQKAATLNSASPPTVVCSNANDSFNITIGNRSQHDYFFCSRRLDTLEASAAAADEQDYATKSLERTARCVSQALPGEPCQSRHL